MPKIAVPFIPIFRPSGDLIFRSSKPLGADVFVEIAQKEEQASGEPNHFAVHSTDELRSGWALLTLNVH